MLGYSPRHAFFKAARIMTPSQSFALQLAAAAGFALAAEPDSALHVLRFTPASDAGPTASVTVTFD